MKVSYRSVETTTAVQSVTLTLTASEVIELKSLLWSRTALRKDYLERDLYNLLVRSLDPSDDLEAEL